MRQAGTRILPECGRGTPYFEVLPSQRVLSDAFWPDSLDCTCMGASSISVHLVVPRAVRSFRYKMSVIQRAWKSYHAWMHNLINNRVAQLKQLEDKQVAIWNAKRDKATRPPLSQL